MYFSNTCLTRKTIKTNRVSLSTHELQDNLKQMDKQNQRRVLKTRVGIEKVVNTNTIWALTNMWNVPNRLSNGYSKLESEWKSNQK